MRFQGLRKDFWRRYGPAIVWAAVLFALSSIPDLSFPIQVSEWEDKYEHVAAYLPLGWLLMRAVSWSGIANRKTFCLAILIGTLFGISDEIHQYFVPGRMADWKDVVADFVGVSLGSWFFGRWRARHSEVREKSGATTRPRATSLSK